MIEMLDVAAVQAEFSSADFGDRRRTARLVEMVTSLGRDPSLSFPKAMGSEAALEGTYRFLNNSDVEASEILAPHQRATRSRISMIEGDVVVAHDTSSFAFRGESTRSGLGPIARAGQGFFAHVSLAILGEASRMPLGVMASKTWVRTGKKPKLRPEQRSHDPNRESKRWFEQVEAVEALKPAGQGLVHVMDREGDGYELLSRMCDHGYRFVVRSAHDRRLMGDHPMLHGLLDSLSHQCERTVPLSRRAGSPFPRTKAIHPSRQERVAQLGFSATRIEFKRPQYALKELTESVVLHVVHVLEIAPPEGEKSVEWVLFTTEPIATPEDILRVVDAYRARWTIEEFFKALKTGCAFEERQLESRHALENALAIFLPIAWRLLLLRNLSRQTGEVLAEVALTPTQIDVLRAVSKRPLSAKPTVKEALLAIAALGGHIKNNGAPGWQVLGRGYHDLLILELGWIAHKRNDQS
jgi:Transposase DNA-binding/Transposase DDE domain